MENTFLPGTVRERIADLMKYHKVSQTDLALKIGCGDSLLSRFLERQTSLETKTLSALPESLTSPPTFFWA